PPFCFLLRRHQPRPTLFPYTTLFRSGRDADGRPNGLLMDAAWDLLSGPDGVKTARHGPNIHLSEPPDTLASHLEAAQRAILGAGDRKSTRLNSSHVSISYAVFCLKKK